MSQIVRYFTGKLIKPKINAPGKQIGINVITAYGALIIVRPPNPKPDISITRNGTHVIVKNKGNTSVLLEDGKQCMTDKKCNKIAKSTRRMYAGNTWEFTVKEDRPVKFLRFYQQKRSLVESN